MEIVNRRFLNTSTASVHASTIEFWKDYPVFAWFGGSREGANDVSIYINNLNNDGKNIIIGNRDVTPRWNPILFAFNDKLWLFEKAGVFCDRWQTFIHNITDWDNDIIEKEIRSKCQILPAGLNGPVKTKPVVGSFIGGKEICCGSSVETFCDWTSYIESYEIKNEWEFSKRSRPLIVKDKVSFINPYSGRSSVSLGIIQPTLWIQDGYVNAFFRSSHGLNKIYYCCGTSEDPVPTNLPNPNSGIDVVCFNERIFLVSNPSTSFRNPLVIQEIKKINNSEWKIIDEIIIREKINESDKKRCFSEELSYPYMVEHDGKLHLTYTYGRSRIEYCVILI